MRGRISREAERLREAFIEQALTIETNDCIVWPYSRQTDGYAAFRGKIVSRIVCERAHGKPPVPWFETAHNCRQSRACINPRHLRWDTRSGNMADTIPHGTQTRGAKIGWGKLTEKDVLEIRAQDGTIPRRQLADRYGVDKSTICLIANRKSWSWLP